MKKAYLFLAAFAALAAPLPASAQQCDDGRAILQKHEDKLAQGKDAARRAETFLLRYYNWRTDKSYLVEVPSMLVPRLREGIAAMAVSDTTREILIDNVEYEDDDVYVSVDVTFHDRDGNRIGMLQLSDYHYDLSLDTQSLYTDGGCDEVVRRLMPAELKKKTGK